MNANTIESAPVTELGKIELAKSAIKRVLDRMREDADVRYHLVYDGKSYARLRDAYSAMTNLSPEEIDEWVFAPKMRQKSSTQILIEIVGVLNRPETYNDAEAVVAKIRGLLAQQFSL